MAENKGKDSTSLQIDCDPNDPVYNGLYEKAQSSGGGDIAPLGSLVLEIRSLPKAPNDPSESK